MYNLHLLIFKKNKYFSITYFLKDLFWFIKKEAYNQLVIFSSLVFKFFFEELNIEISQKKSQNYIDFIMQQVYTKIQTLESEEV